MIILTQIPAEIMEILPFLIPLVIAQLALLAYTLWHIFTHPNYRRWNRMTWVIIVLIGMQFWGPILYFLFGKEEA
ncbi:MAG: PLDc N-terminal domain-containing protein [Culicoidibacterales bacterium]